METVMARSALPELNKTDFEVMKTLWKGGGRLSAREVHEGLHGHFGWAYSTTRTTLERMVKKGLLQKNEFHGLNLYAPAVSKTAVLAARVREFAESVLEMEAAPVVSLFADSDAVSADELAELRRLVDETGEVE